MCDCFLIVYSLTKNSSFEKVTEIKMKICKTKNYLNSSNVPILIVGNKHDMLDDREVSNSMIDFKSQIRTSLNYYVSAKTGHNVEKCFTKLLKMQQKYFKKNQSNNNLVFENNSHCCY